MKIFDASNMINERSTIYEKYGCTMRVRCTMLEEILGSLPNDKELYTNYIASRAPDALTREEQIAEFGVIESIEKQTTIFPKDKNGNPLIYGYQFDGFLKASIKALKYVPGSLIYKDKSFNSKNKSIIDTKIKTFPVGGSNSNNRKILIQGFNLEDLHICQRPLFIQDRVGTRVSLASSEAIPAGAYIDIDIYMMDETFRPYIEEALDYGQINGLLQWRNSGKGAFSWNYI